MSDTHLGLIAENLYLDVFLEKNVSTMVIKPSFKIREGFKKGFTRASLPPQLSCIMTFLNQILKLIYRKSQKKAVKSNIGNFFRKCYFNFFNGKNWPVFAGFELFFPSNSILQTFEIKLMLPNDGQMLVNDFRHKNFGISIILSWVMAIFMKKWGNLSIYKAKQWFCKYFLLKWP